MRVKRAGFKPSLNLLYALEGALLDCHWQEVPDDTPQRTGRRRRSRHRAAAAAAQPPRRRAGDDHAWWPTEDAAPALRSVRRAGPDTTQRLTRLILCAAPGALA